MGSIKEKRRRNDYKGSNFKLTCKLKREGSIRVTR